MKVSNVSFGARLTQDTFDFLVQARTSGLKTEKMEDLMRNIYKDKFIRTEKRGDKLIGMEIVDNPDDNYLFADKRTAILENEDYSNLEGDENIMSDFLSAGLFKFYKINQETIDKITKKLQIFKKNEKLTPEKIARNELIKKFGFPVSRNCEVKNNQQVAAQFEEYV